MNFTGRRCSEITVIPFSPTRVEAEMKVRMELSYEELAVLAKLSRRNFDMSFMEEK